MAEVTHSNDLPEVFHAPSPVRSYASALKKDFAHWWAAYPTICGLRRTTFWLLMLLAIVIVGAAAGGGIGGSLAVQNAKSNTYTSTALLSQTASIQPLTASIPPSTASIPPSTASILPSTTSIPPSASSNASTTASIPPPASSTIPNASTSIYSAPAASTIPLIDVGCPSGSMGSYLIAGSYNTSATFKVFCNQNYDHDDMIGIVAYSINNCIDACLTMNNYNYKKDICIGINIEAPLSVAVLENHGANCWLKNASSLPTLSLFGPGDSGASARLCLDSSCSSFV